MMLVHIVVKLIDVQSVGMPKSTRVIKKENDNGKDNTVKRQ